MLSLLVRPALAPSPPDEAQRRHAWEIVSAHGRSAVARYALLSDKSFYFTRWPVISLSSRIVAVALAAQSVCR
jgi:hypothetical protein